MWRYMCSAHYFCLNTWLHHFVELSVEVGTRELLIQQKYLLWLQLDDDLHDFIRTGAMINWISWTPFPILRSAIIHTSTFDLSNNRITISTFPCTCRAMVVSICTCNYLFICIAEKWHKNISLPNCPWSHIIHSNSSVHSFYLNGGTQEIGSQVGCCWDQVLSRLQITSSVAI